MLRIIIDGCFVGSPQGYVFTWYPDISPRDISPHDISPHDFLLRDISPQMKNATFRPYIFANYSFFDRNIKFTY